MGLNFAYSVRLQNLVAILVTITLGLVNFMAVRGILPSIMRDEYIYRLAADPSVSSEFQFGNLLFESLYSLTFHGGHDFYTWAKIANGLMLALAGWFLFITARRLLSPLTALVSVVIFGLSPLMLSGSYFTPEPAFLAVSGAAIYLFISITSKESKFSPAQFGLLFITLLMLSFIKPHGVVTALVLLPFAALTKFGQSYNPAGRLALAIASLTALQVIRNLVFLSVGATNGVTLFSPEYDRALSGFLAPFFKASPQLAGDFALLALNLVGIFTSSLVTYFALRWLRGRKVHMENFEIGIAILFVVLILMSMGFAYFATVLGDDHSHRFLFRYVEYVVPVVLLLWYRRAITRDGHRPMALLLLITIATTMVLFAVFSIDTDLVDSVVLYGLGFTEAIFFIVLAGFFAVTNLLFPSRPLVVITSLALSASLVLGGTLAIGQQREDNSTPSSADALGLYLGDQPNSFFTGRSVLISENYTMAHVGAFWSGQYIEVVLLTQLEQMDCLFYLQTYDTVIYLTPEKPTCEAVPIEVGPGFQVFKNN